jgi:hypothetical protein
MGFRRNRMTTYGQRGGEGPNTDKTAAVFSFIRPDGTTGTKRVFKDIPEESPVYNVLLYPPYNGYGWHTGRVATCSSAFAEVFRSHASVAATKRLDPPPMPVVVPARRVK